ncbi:MAG: hypothetical protein ABSE49_09245, partial [Polyangiaceae bacterium]
MPATYSAIERRAESGSVTLSLRGRLTFPEAAGIWTEVSKSVEAVERGDRLDLDMSAVDAVDGGTMA